MKKKVKKREKFFVSDNSFAEEVKLSLKRKPAKTKKMNEIQKKIITAINTSFGANQPGRNRRIRLSWIYGHLPDIRHEEIEKAIYEWEGVSIVGDSLDGGIEIPAKYFQ